MEDPGKYISSRLPAVDDVMRLVDVRHGTIIMEPTCRLVHEDMTPYYLPKPRDTGDPSNISFYIDGLGLEHNASEDVQGSGTFTLHEYPGIEQFSSLTDMMQVYSTYYDGDGNVLLDIPQFVLSFTINDRNLEDTGNSQSITGHDPTVRLRDLGFLTNYTIPAGVNVVDAVRTMLMMDKLPPSQGGRRPAYIGLWPDPNNPALSPAGCEAIGANIPSWRINIEPTALTLPSALRFDWTENFLAAINVLLASINYWPLWCDRHGVFRSSRIPYESGFVPNVNKDLWTGADTILHDPIGVKMQDTTGIYNVVEARCEDNTRAPMIAVAWNTALNSYISIPNIGRPILKQPGIQLDNVWDQTVLQAAADISLEFGAIGSQSIDYATWFDPFVDPHDVHGVNSWSPDGQRLDLDSTANPFLLTHIQWDYDQFATSYTAGRLVPL